MDLAILCLLLIAIIALALSAHLLKPSAKHEADEDDGLEEEDEGVLQPGRAASRRKTSAKKAEKLRQKEERQRAREALLQEQRRRKEEQAALRAAQEEKEREMALEAEARRRRKAMDKECAADEEYLKWKRTMVVEEQGCFEINEPDMAEVTHMFLSQVKSQRMCLLADLSDQFNMTIDRVVAMLKDLQAQGQLDGIFDDRGKYICLSKEDLQHISQFINQRGRVSLASIAYEMNRFWQEGDVNPVRL